MNLPNDYLWKLLTVGGLSTIIAIFWLIRWDWVARTWHELAFQLNRAFYAARRRASCRRYTYAINTAIAGIIGEVSGLTVKGFMIRYKKTGFDIFMEEETDNFILWLDTERQLQEALAAGILNYVSAAFFIDARPYCDIDLLEAVDFTLAEHILIACNLTQAQLFLRRKMDSKTAEDLRLRSALQIVEGLHQEGFLTRILLREIVCVAKKLPDAAPSGPRLRRETISFARFLWKGLHQPSISECVNRNETPKLIN